MREKNVKRAAKALYESQGDDKNELLSQLIPDEEVQKRVKDQGRALQILEKLVLPTGKFSFTKKEMKNTLLSKLEEKGHRIQDDEEPDTEEYAEEKRIAMEERLALVPDVLGKQLSDPEEEQDYEKESEFYYCPICGNNLLEDSNICPNEENHTREDIIEKDLKDFLVLNKVKPNNEEERDEFAPYGFSEELTWNLIGQAYIDGLRTGLDRK